jgi:hypothetical protein
MPCGIRIDIWLAPRINMASTVADPGSRFKGELLL